MEKNIMNIAKEMATATTEYEAFVKCIEAKNAAVSENQFSAINIASHNLGEALTALNTVLKTTFFEELFKLPDNEIVRTCIEVGAFELFAVKNDSKRGEGFVAEGSKVDIIDIEEVFKACLERQTADNVRKIFRDSFYLEHIDNLCHVIFAAKCKDMGIDPKANKKYTPYCSFKIAKGAECNIDTKTGIAKAMQICFDSLVYEEIVDKKGNKVNKYKVDTRYEKALLANFSKWSSKSINGVSFPNYATFHKMFMRIAHMVLTGKEIVAE